MKRKITQKIVLIISVLLCCFFLASCTKEKEVVSVSDSTVAKFEFAEDEGYKLFTSEVGSLYTFESLNIEPSEESFEGEWIYRITYDPKSIVPEGNEVIVLLGEKNISINGQVYVAREGTKYSDVLDWAVAKYEYFDYELIQE